MRIVLQQAFPLGRFHATPWRANPFDDPYGEWPPSPWRLVRAVVSRWYQWEREGSLSLGANELDALVVALCTSNYQFHLPASARVGSRLRQYFPAEFGWNPKEKRKSGLRSYARSLAQDNFWCVPSTSDAAIWWFIDGDRWTGSLMTALDRCVERISYFGRAETLTRVRRVSDGFPEPNCPLLEHRMPGSVPVLAPSPNASRSDVERVTDDNENTKRSIPLGSRLMYALRPPRPPAREMADTRLARPNCRLIQLALGWNVAPEPRVVVRLTARFRSVVLREVLRIKTGVQNASWTRVDSSVRQMLADMFGKDARGKPLRSHQHTEFLAWCEDGFPTRLLVWRDGRPFDGDEQTAILRAASRELSWAADGLDPDAWKVRLVPLDGAVPPPPGFDHAPARCWESVTPYVPPRHHLRKGTVRARESVSSQMRRELAARGVPGAERVEVELASQATWVAVHVPRRHRRGRSLLGDKRGYHVRVVFPEPVRGPIRLGHSSSFGLGLFRPFDAAL